MKIFETHAHLDFKDFDKDRDDLLKKCFKEGIEYIINVGTDKKTSEDSIALAAKYKQVYASVGFHPHDAESYDRELVKKLAAEKKVVAIGEIGLDYFKNYCPRDIQKKAFEDQLQLANELELPVIIHDRDAHEDCYDLLVKYNPKKVVFHCFTGDALFAQKCLEQGWFLSFTGVVTYKNSGLDDVVRQVPRDRFFIETDSPFLSPVPMRGKRNSPLNLRHIVEKIADLKRMSPNKVAEASYENALEFFFPKDN